MKPFSFFAIAACILVIGGAGASAHASEPTHLSTHDAWTAYTFKENGNTVCYMASEPIKEEGNYTRRGKIYALITHRPAEGSKNVFSYITGYPYKEGSEATLEIDGKKFALFTQDESAWAPDAETDNRIAQAIRKGSKMVIKGTSRRGTLTTDTFSLKGSSGAHDAIGGACK